MRQCLFKKNQQAGFTLVEMLVYVAILAIITVITITAVLRYSVLVDDMHARTQLVEVAHGSLERLVREARNADSVNIAESDLLKATSTLVLAGESYATTISGTTTDLVVERDGAAFPLNTSGVSLDAFYVYHYTSAGGAEAVRFVVTYAATSSSGVMRETFEAFSVLRGSYE